MRDKPSVGRKPAGAVNRAQAMREQALSVAMKRKEEFLGARVPRALRDQVMERANTLGVPVSILIRNILEEAFKRPVAPVACSAPPQESLQKGRGIERFPAVLGWEVMRLNRPAACACCGTPLLPGASVTLGLVSGMVEAGAAHIILCDQCQGLM